MDHSPSSQTDRATTALTDDQGRALLALARAAIEEQLTGVASSGPRPDWQARPAATFVSVYVDGELRGCVGSLEPRRPLDEDVRGNARYAAFSDRRFAPVRADELARMAVEVSVLSPLEPVPVRSEAEALAALRPGVDGVVLALGTQRGTLLPKVWEDLPEPRDFLRTVKRKAALPEAFWHPDLRMYRYRVDVWSEADARRARS